MYHTYIYIYIIYTYIYIYHIHIYIYISHIYIDNPYKARPMYNWGTIWLSELATYDQNSLELTTASHSSDKGS